MYPTDDPNLELYLSSL